MMQVLPVVLAAAIVPWENPDITEINRLPARTISIPCETEDLAFDIARGTRRKEESRWIMSLNGTWDFAWKRSPEVAEWEKSAKIDVPGCWQLLGDFDPPLYSNMTYPFLKDAPRVMGEPKDKSWTSMKFRNPVGLYRTRFRRPWRWWFRKTTLHFDGVSSAFYVRVNGKDVGYAEDSRLPSEFDLTPYLKTFGENTLEVEVYKHCDGSYLEDQDFWRLSGIFRDVYLVSESKGAPFDLVVETKLADDMKGGSFAVRDEKGAVLKERQITSVIPWSSEKPVVYVTPIEHKWGWWIFGGTDFRAVTFGFRKIEIRDSVVYLNGKRVLFKGVNRHEMEPATGYAVTSAGMKRDVELLKAFNINAVRTSHYPDAPEWYDLCDREGVMVCCEANVEGHDYGYGAEALAKNPLYEKSIVERSVRMVKTFRNHPSIVFWSMGNETGDGDNFAAARKAILEIDSTRPVHYERALDGANTDIYAEMYARPWDVERYLKNSPKKPVILCEYSHAMGNSNGGLHKYWDLAKRYPSFQGGFIWDFMDQAIWKVDSRGKWLAYGGDFGDRPNDDNFNCNGLFDALRNPHPGAVEMKHAYQDIRCESFDFESGMVVISNCFQFTSLTDFDCRWMALDADGKTVADGSLVLGDIRPGEAKAFTLSGFAGDSVSFAFIGDIGCVAWDGFSRPFKAKTVMSGTPDALAASAFKLNFWRAPTDNDRGWDMPSVCRVWKDATATQNLPDGVKSDLKASRLADGSLLVDWTLTVPKGLPPIPRVGLTFTVPKAKEVSWHGLGPWENYSDRATAAMVGVYHASVGLVSGIADPKTGTISYPADRLNPDNYIEPGEQGYRTGCHSMAVGDIHVEAVNAPFCFNVWPYPQTMLEGKKHQWELSEADVLTVNIDAAQMGVGGDNSWGARPHDEFMLKDGTYRLVFVVKGLAKSE